MNLECRPDGIGAGMAARTAAPAGASARALALLVLLAPFLAALGALATGGGVARADGPVLTLPAAAGSRWEVLAGYNTGTHNGNNPWALDIVRVDAPTAGSAVLAPLDGRVGYVAAGCLTVDDGPDVSVLLCHLFPSPGLRVGQKVARGALLGTVAPDGQAHNNGIAHIHLAVHDSRGGFGPSVPMIGRYALEGRNLWAVSEWNAYYGMRFTSSTATAGQLSGAVAAPSSPQGTAAAGLVLSGGAPHGGGVGLFVYSGGEAIGLAAAIGCPADSAAFWATSGGRFIVFVPASAVPAVNAEWNARFGGGIPFNTPLLGRCTA